VSGCLFNLKHHKLLRFSPAVAASLLRDVVVQWKDNTSSKDNGDNNKNIQEIIYEDVSLMKQPQGGFQCGGFCGPNLPMVYIFPIRRAAEGAVACVRTVYASLTRYVVHGCEHNPF